jgi:predicted amidohydrolase YtcJ
VLVWGSDWPVTGVEPLDGIETAVTRRYPGGRDPQGIEDAPWIPTQRLTLVEAVAAYTASGAYLLHAEAERGTIAVGKLADLVVLSRNLFAADPLTIHAIDVDMTLIGGRVVFERR